MRHLIKYVMFFLISVLIVSLILFFSLIISSQSQNSATKIYGQPTIDLALTGLILVDSELNSISDPQTILIKNGIIEKIQPEKDPIPEVYEKKDMNGLFGMHSLADMHSHAFDRSDLVLDLAYGVTHVRNMMGFPAHLKWREEVENHHLSGAQVNTAGPTLNSGNDGTPFHNMLESDDELIEAVQRVKAEGYDFIKVYDGLNAHQLGLIAKESEKLKIGFAGHPQKHVPLDTILASGIVSIEHVEEVFQSIMNYKFDKELAHQIGKRLHETKTPVAITMSAYNHIYRTAKEKDAFLSTLPMEYISPVVRFIGDKQMEEWLNPNEGAFNWTIKKYTFLEEIVRILKEEKVTFLLGTDTGPSYTVHGWNMHRELELLQSIGLTPAEIISSGTINAAKVLQMDSFAGKIQENTAANMVIVSANPLEDLSVLENPEFQITNSYWYTKSDLFDMRAYSITAQSPWYITIGRMLEYVWDK